MRLGMALMACSSCLALAAQADTLLVVGAVPVSSGDSAVIERLESLGHAVTVVKDSASSAASVNGKELVVISNSVAPGKVGNKFNQVPVPVLTFEPSVYDNLGMTGTVAGTDFGQSATQTQMRVVGTHPLAAGLSGVVTIGNAPVRLSWGKPGASAAVAATLKGNSTRATIFGYEAGSQLVNGTSAAARRVAVYPNSGATDAWNVNGRALFDAAVQWASGGSTPPAETVRIMPLGDSITKGRTNHWSYRRDLESALDDAGCAFDFVGTQSGPGSAPGAPLGDRDHEGHSGLRTDQIRARINNWLPGNGNDWALVHVGTNDVLQGTSIPAARTNISQIIDRLRNANPSVGILLAQVIPNLPGNEAAVMALNDEIASLAPEKSTPASPVIVVDQYSGYSTFTHNYDEIHPNDAGDARLAQRFFEALLPQIAGYCGQ
ncbi:MAG TPA: SGNH/GDSL hydrolase family protein [Steroidobacteraceae bacterium]|nr:SGNH/GDSL hydrolase family protein [Steroidobacteraceae bacterium]